MWPIEYLRYQYQLKKARILLEDISANHRYNGNGAYTTPDAPAISSKRAHLVFLYDYNIWKEMQDLLVGRAGRAFTNINVEAFVSNRTGKVIAFHSRNEPKPTWSDCQANNPGLPIRGELWLVSPKSIFKLDKFYGNRVHCLREEIVCTGWRHKSYYSKLHNRIHITKSVQRTIKAWVYLGIPEQWDIDAGYNWKPLKIRQSKNKEPLYFYYHTYRE